MTGQPLPSNEPHAAEEIPRGWRYWLGMGLLVLSFALPILALILVPLFGFPEGVNAALYALSLAGGPDVLLVLAAGAMGKENIDRILGKLAPWLKRLVHWDRVSRGRYVVGLWLLALSVVVPFVVTFFFEDSVVMAGNEPGWGYYVVVGSYFLFLAAFFVCGAPLWDRIRAIFTWDAQITFPPPDQASEENLPADGHSTHRPEEQ